MADIIEHANMSDDDFLQHPLPTTGDAPVVEQEKEEESPAPTQNEPETPVAEQPKQEETPAKSEAELALEKASAEAGETPDPVEKPVEPVAEKPTEEPVKPEDKPADTPKEDAPKPEETPDYKALYEQIMKPFTANGKTINLQNTDEVIQLMQMGANYTRKMQEIAPVRRMAEMLKKADLNEDKLSFLIDLDKKNPEAIKKLIKESGLDPLDIDTSKEPAYQEGNHRVSDEDMAFTAVLDELASNPKGKETLVAINETWDQTSKDALWEKPDLMTVIHSQRELGIYDQITDEMDRQKTLGKLSPTTPFLEAYKIVGDQLLAAGKFGNQEPEKTDPEPEQPAPKPDPEPVAVRPLAPKAPDNSDKIEAAAPSRTVPKNAREVVNFSSMSDEDFLKSANFSGRV